MIANPDKEKLINYADEAFWKDFLILFLPLELGTAPDDFLTRQPVSMFSPTTSNRSPV